MTYGYEVHQRNDRMLDVAKRMSNVATENVLPGALLVNYIPIRTKSRLFTYDIFTTYTLVRHIPEWLPGLSYKPLARNGYNLGNEVLYPPLQFVRQSIVSGYFSGHHSFSNNTLFTLKLNGTAVPSLALENLQEVENLKLTSSDRDEAENMIAEALASLYAGRYLLLC
jgi:hypothetical protein